MTDALNDFAFTQPKWENAAKGYDQNTTGWPEYNGGIEMPKRVHLRLGQRYFRFANSKAPREQSQLGGGWWIEFETLNTISSFARQHSTPRHAACSALFAWPAVGMDGVRQVGKCISGKAS